MRASLNLNSSDWVLSSELLQHFIQMHSIPHLVRFNVFQLHITPLSVEEVKTRFRTILFLGPQQVCRLTWASAPRAAISWNGTSGVVRGYAAASSLTCVIWYNINISWSSHHIGNRQEDLYDRWCLFQSPWLLSGTGESISSRCTWDGYEMSSPRRDFTLRELGPFLNPCFSRRGFHWTPLRCLNGSSCTMRIRCHTQRFIFVLWRSYQCWYEIFIIINLFHPIKLSIAPVICFNHSNSQFSFFHVYLWIVTLSLIILLDWCIKEQLISYVLTLLE